VSVEVKLTPVISTCHNYVDSSGAEKKTTIIVAPIGLERRGEKTVISWACSRGAACRNPECRYSAAFKEKTMVPVASTSVSEDAC
jgi:hypothetical protein